MIQKEFYCIFKKDWLSHNQEYIFKITEISMCSISKLIKLAKFLFNA